MTDFLQREKFKHLHGKEFLELCVRGGDRWIHLTFNDYGMGVHKAIDLRMIETVIRIMQKHGVAQTISFNSNFMNPIGVTLQEVVVASGGSTNSGYQKDCLIELCAQMYVNKPKLAIWASFDPMYWTRGTEHPCPEIYALDQHGVITDAWIPDEGG